MAYNTDPTKGGIKHDGQKNQLELISFVGIEAVGRVGTYGALKYADDNWRKGMPWRRMLGAALRHVFAWARGEDNDTESGESHLAHAAWCLLALIEFQETGNGVDDRWRPRTDPRDPQVRCPECEREPCACCEGCDQYPCRC